MMMKAKHILGVCLLSLIGLECHSQASVANNGFGPPAYLGWNSSTPFDLNINHKGPASMLFRTNGNSRMAITPAGKIFMRSSIPSPVPSQGTSRYMTILADNQEINGIELEESFGLLPFKEGFEIRVKDGRNSQYGLRSIAYGNTGPGDNYGIASLVSNFGTSPGTTTGIFASVGPSPSSTGILAGYFDGDLFATVLSGPSDENLKSSIEEIDDVEMDKLMDVWATSHYFNPDLSNMNVPLNRQFGVIAQNVDSLYPDMTMDLVHVNKAAFLDEIDSNSGNDYSEEFEYKVVDYSQFIALLTKGWQDQSSKLAEQNSRLAALNQKLNTMESQLAVFENNYRLNQSARVEKYVLFPNPSHDIVNVEVILSEESLTTISMYDLNMKKLEDLLSPTILNGKSTFQFNLSDYESGLYLIILKTGEELFTLKLQL